MALTFIYNFQLFFFLVPAGAQGGFYCGGALINKNYVLTGILFILLVCLESCENNFKQLSYSIYMFISFLQCAHITAAHCIRGTSLVKSRFTATSVRLGEHDLLSEIDCEEVFIVTLIFNTESVDKFDFYFQGECADRPIDVPVEKTIVHENYKPESHLQNDDIALLRLSQSVRFTDWIRPICLPFANHLRNKNFDSSPLVVAGFGKTENGSFIFIEFNLLKNSIELSTSIALIHHFDLQHLEAMSN